MGKHQDLTGQTFDRLYVVGESGKNKHGAITWECLCECGNTHSTVTTGSLIGGMVRSCGCLLKDHCRISFTTHGLSRKDGKPNPLFQCWRGMIDRCDNPKNSHYGDYGGRGIKVCRDWQDPAKFMEDMGERPEGLSLDRINNNLGYFKSNCRWASDSIQNINQRTSKRNKYGFRGVSFDAKCKKIQAKIFLNGKNKFLGFHETPELAARAYDKAVKEFRQDGAKLNFKD